MAGVGALAGAITGGLALGQAKQLKSECLGGHCTTPDTQSRLDRATALANGANASFAIAGAGVIAGIVGLALERSKPRATALVPALMLEVGPSWLALRGRF